MNKIFKTYNLLFLGDISLNGNYNELYQNGIKLFVGIKDILFNSDFVVGNLECLAEGDKGENLLKNPRLKTDLKTLNYLKDINLGLALLAHNHVYDNLEDGFIKTINFLDENKIYHIGAALSPKEAEKPFIKVFNGENVCFLNYVTKDTNPSMPPDATVYLNWFEEHKVIKDIKKYKRTCDKVVLCLHWGGRCEGGYYPYWDQPIIAKKLIDAGADLIIGSHSHTFQPFEIYKGKYIFYSLGNFCFSDIYSDNKIIELDRKKRMKSAIISYNIIENKTQLYPIDFENIKTIINDNIRRDINKRQKRFALMKNNRFLWSLYFLKYKFLNPVFFYFFGNDRKFWYQLNKLNIGKIRRFLKI